MVEPKQKTATSGELILAEAGRTNYRIVVPDAPGESTRYAAEELQRFIREMAGAELPVVSDRQPQSAHEVIVGQGSRLQQLGLSLDLKALGGEGYRLQTAGSHLAIAGGEPRGTLYGVYGLLEDHLGCRWFTPTVSRIPRRDRLVIPNLNETQIPVLEYREPFVYDCFDGDWCARNRMNSQAGRLTEKHGGKITYCGFVHTFNQILPPDRYFADHPEYFSEIDGRRLGERSQLCCTNEDVIGLVTEAVRQRMRDHPDAFVFSVSQDDWYNFCECSNCAALSEEEDSTGAPVFYLVNRVAEAVQREFPNQAVDTLAYQWTRRPPKSLRPRPNVIVRLCSIECCRAHSFEACDHERNRRFREDAAGWAKICNRLWVWDYATNFAHYLLPFPDLRALGSNIRFFVRNNVRGIFEQSSYQTPNGELAPLRGYLTAKLLWNSDSDTDSVMDEFLAAVYGAADAPIRRYVDLLHDKVERENIHFRIHDAAVAPYLTEDLLLEADRLWDAAEAAVAGHAEVLERVQIARLCIDYAWLERLRAQLADGSRPRDEHFDRRAARFCSVGERAGLTWMSEAGLMFPEYREQLRHGTGSVAPR